MTTRLQSSALGDGQGEFRLLDYRGIEKGELTGAGKPAWRSPTRLHTENQVIYEATSKTGD